MKLSKEFKTGVVVAVGVCLLIFGIFFLKGTNLFGENREYYAVYDHIDGLAPSNPITINGFKVGQIKDIHLYPDNSRRVVIVLQIFEESIKIPKGSIASIYSSDLLGSKAVEIKMTDKPMYHSVGDTLGTSTQESLSAAVRAELAPLRAKTIELIGSIDSAVMIVRSILNEDARSSLSESFKGIQRAINTFENTAIKLDTMIAAERAKISSIFSNVQSIAQTMASNNDHLTNIITNFSSISDSLAAADLTTTINNTKDAMAEMEDIMSKINQGQGTMGMLVNNDSLYNSLNSSSQSLDLLVEDLRVNPHRYLHFSVFGRKPKAQLNLTRKEQEKLKELLK